MSGGTVSVLFVCMGNICRSPAAEGVFRHHADEMGLLDCFHVDSAGTGGWHAGEAPDARMSAAAIDRGFVLQGAARKVEAEDLETFHHVLCMDTDNLRAVEQFGGRTARVSMMLDHHPTTGERDVPDPYYGGEDGFAHVIDLLDVACRHLLTNLVEWHGLRA